MNPFDLPPSTPPVSIEPPDPPAPRRGRMAIVAFASAGLLAGGVIGVSALASAGDPELESSDQPPAAGEAATLGSDDESPDSGDDTGTPTIEGEIVIDTGDGEPMVIDVGELVEQGKEQLARLEQCAGVSLWSTDGSLLDMAVDADEFVLGDLELDEMFEKFEEMIGGWSDEGVLQGEGLFVDDKIGEGELTVMGPDGLTIIDLGDGDASVTVARDGASGELTITTEGTASERSLDDLLAEFDLAEWADDLPLDDLKIDEFLSGDLDELLNDLAGEFESSELGGIDPQQIADCLTDLE